MRSLEARLASVNILLTKSTSEEDKEEVRGYLIGSGRGYQVIVEGCFKLLGGRRFKKPLYLTIINGKYIDLVDSDAEVLKLEQYGDLEKLKTAIVNHWDEEYKDEQTISFDNIVEY